MVHTHMPSLITMILFQSYFSDKSNDQTVIRDNPLILLIPFTIPMTTIRQRFTVISDQIYTNNAIHLVVMYQYVISRKDIVTYERDSRLKK
jgi:hypothetical protein